MDWKNKKWMTYPLLIILFVAVAPLLLLQLDGESSKNKIIPEISGISGWFNSPPLTLAQLRGKVVIVDFWTYSCINCLRTIPYLNRWYEKYKDKGLVIIGVHSPEFLFEKELSRVQSAVNELQIKYPVALDSDHKTWDAFANHYWPHKFFVGSDGSIRFEVIGEGHYEDSEEKIRELLAETGVTLDGPLTPVEGEKVNFQKIKSPEIFFGAFHGGFLGNPLGILAGKNTAYALPPHLEEHAYYLVGHWAVSEEYAVHHDSTPGEILIKYEAKSVNWVAGTDRKGIWVEVQLDRHDLTPDQMGKDIVIDSAGKSRVFISDKKLYRIVNNQAGYGKHLLILKIADPDLESYTFTFG
ncbi:MAG: redoxin domain-containing protein [Nitrospirae bacterium]|nr:redoxin domain-containing protein [Nitrospirota bacterium]